MVKLTRKGKPIPYCIDILFPHMQLWPLPYGHCTRNFLIVLKTLRNCCVRNISKSIATCKTALPLPNSIATCKTALPLPRFMFTTFSVAELIICQTGMSSLRCYRKYSKLDVSEAELETEIY